MSLLSLFLLSLQLTAVKCTFDGNSFQGSLERPLAQAACYRLFSREGDIGCRTPSSKTSTGALYEISDLSDVEEAKKLDIDLAYIIPATLLNSTLLSSLHRAKGIIVVENDEIWSEVEVGMFSPELRTPQGAGTAQRHLSIGPEIPWNLHGNGMSYESFKIPIVRADITENDFLRTYAFENRRYGYFSTRVNYVDFDFYMGRSGLTSKDCLEWRDIYGDRSPQCLPLGGNSIWGTAGNLDSRKKIVATVGIDSTAMFHDLAFGANDAAASVAAFLGAIEAVGRYDHHSLDYQILFFAANAEEWGYAGSRRFVKDILSFECKNYIPVSKSHLTGLPMCADPVYPDILFTRILHGENSSISEESMLKSIVALDQIGSVYQDDEHGNTNMYIHSLESDSSTVSNIQASGSLVPGVSLQLADDNDVPPSPLTSFLKEIVSLSDESAVITGYNRAFNDPRFHSHYDNASFISEDAVIRYCFFYYVCNTCFIHPFI